MVNVNSYNKENLVKVLFQARGEAVSGMRLSDRLGISRVAIWKHVTSLKKAGLDIISSPKGYALPNPDDLLMPFCFRSEFQDRIFHFLETDSTMEQARHLARSGAPHLSVVIAENQTQGRGRLRRKWTSPRGGLWFTVILKQDIPAVWSHLVNFAASLSLSRTLTHLFGLDIRVKWPNDLLLEGRKLAGLLSEMATQGELAEYINIGIGLNVNQSPGPDEPGAISIIDALNREVPRRPILEAFLEEFQHQIRILDADRILADWKTRTATIGRPVRIQTSERTYEGEALDVDNTGALLIRDAAGNIQTVVYGDCFHV